ncbi:DUF1294 domain-containing protein [Streptococcus sp. zg-JUN1979]|uniref:DUF1294 domain-containing protein n=1 Tax=Streptococcus sp. zg-JUN1979 TaxID=3391450 RepID=UPI0039AED0FC
MIPYSYIINTSKSYIFIGLFCWNVIVFFLYGIDKYKAVKDSWRISEKRLLTYESVTESVTLN